MIQSRDHEWHLVVSFIKDRAWGCEYQCTLVPRYAFWCPKCSEWMWSALGAFADQPERWAWYYKAWYYKKDGNWVVEAV